MAQFFEDFEGKSVGSSAPSGFTESWQGTGFWSVEDFNSDRVVSYNQGSNTFAFLSWTELGTFTDSEVVARVQSTSTANAQTAVVLRGNSGTGSGNTTGYYFPLVNTDRVAIVKMVNGSETSLAIDLTGPTINANTYYWIRAQASGSTLRVKYWQDGTEEPAGWRIETTDTDITSGYSGVFARAFQGTKRYSLIGVGTNGDPAPTEAPGGGAVTGSGTLASGPATISGTSTRVPVSTGTLAAQPSTIDGTSTGVVTGTGSLSSGPSTIDGASVGVHTSSGTLESGPATIDGTSSIGSVTTSSGSLEISPASISGTSTAVHTSSGSLNSGPASISGSSLKVVTSSGELRAAPASISGQSQIGNVVTSSGTLESGPSTIDGTSTGVKTSTGSLQAQPASISGTALRVVTSSGELVAARATIEGSDRGALPRPVINPGTVDISTVYSSAEVETEYGSIDISPKYGTTDY